MTKLLEKKAQIAKIKTGWANYLITHVGKIEKEEFEKATDFATAGYGYTLLEEICKMDEKFPKPNGVYVGGEYCHCCYGKGKRYEGKKAEEKIYFIQDQVLYSVLSINSTEFQNGEYSY